MQELEHIPKRAVLQVDNVSIVCKSDNERSYTVYAAIVGTFFIKPFWSNIAERAKQISCSRDENSPA
jgi:hypothetical protein